MAATYEESRIQLLAYPVDEKWAAEQDDLVNSNEVPPRVKCCCRADTRGRRRNALVRGGVIALAGLLLTLVVFIAMEVFCPHIGSLVKRENNGNNNGNNGNSSNAFTNQHLWIIIVCVVGII